MSLAPGQKLAHYEILGPLGAGAMGEVWRARDTRLGREVAIKVLPEQFASDDERLRRFEREAKTLAALNHPNVAQIFGVDQVDDTCFIVLELVPGESLDERLKRGPLPIDEALDVALQVAEGLEAAHEAGVIHRDLKPANVRITPDGRVKLLDFGLAKPMRDAHETESSTDSVPSTEAGRVLGTPNYMAPEQARGKPIDKRVDVWAFGCVLYECLTARRAFEGETLSDTLAAVLDKEPDWSRVPTAAPRHVRELLRRCFAKDSSLRVRDIGEARIALGAPPPSPEPGQPGGLRAFAIVALAAVLIGAATVWLFGGGDSGPKLGAFQQLNLRTEAIFRAAFAPDGETVVYSAARSGTNLELFVVRPDAPEPQPLGLHGTHLLGVSSRGELAVLTGARHHSHRVFVGTLARMPMQGGAPREILADVHDACWSLDGTELAIVRNVNGKDRLEYPIGTVLVESSGYLSEPRISPAGDRIAYFAHPYRGDDRGSVNVVDLEGRARVLADGYWGEEGLTWSEDGSEILYSAGLSGVSQDVFAVTLAGEPRVVFQGAGGLTIHDVQADGRWLVTRDAIAYRVGVHVCGEAEDRDLTWLDGSAPGSLSQDGRTLVFCETGTGMGPNYAVCVRKTDGSAVVRLGDGAPRGLSPDGKWVAAAISSTPPRLVLYPIGAGETRDLDHGDWLQCSRGTWFRDGQRILLEGAQAGQGPRCWVQPIDGGKRRAVTPEGTSEGHLSPDEQRILARGPDGAYFIYLIDGGEAQPVKCLAEDIVLHWSMDGRSVLAWRGGSVPCRVERVDLESGRRELFREMGPRNLTGVILVRPCFITDDEQSYVYGQWGMTSTLYVTERGEGR